MQAQLTITGWPVLLTLEEACRYLSLEKDCFLTLAARWKLCPVEIDNDVVMWRIRDLDLLVRRLPTANEFLDRINLPRSFTLDRSTIDQIVQALATRLETGASLLGREMPQLVSIKETAKQLGLGRSTIYQMINEGSLQVRRIGGRTLVTQESIQALLGI